MNNEKLAKLIQEKPEVLEMIKSEETSAEEIKAVLEANGIDFEELMNEVSTEGSDELSESELDNVAGGGLIGSAWKFGKAVGISLNRKVYGKNAFYSAKEEKNAWADFEKSLGNL